MPSTARRTANWLTLWGVSCCVALTGIPAAEGDAEGPEPRTDGIAARYVGDVGIGADPAVVLAEDFEDDGLRERGWYDLNGWGKRLIVSDEDSATGERSLQLIYPEGHTGPWLRAPHFDRGYETLHVRYYRKWAAGWDWGGPGDGNGHDTRLVANGPDVGQRAYKDADAIVLMMESCTHFNPWKRGLFGLMQYTRKEYFSDAMQQARRARDPEGHRLRGREWWLATVDGSRSPRSEPGRWYCVEYGATMNTPGQADGRIQGWIDGVLVYDIQDCLIRDADQGELLWRRWWIGPYFHGGTTQDQRSAIDSLVIATDYVGPISQAQAE